MKEIGLGELSSDQLLAMKIHDVTPEYAKKMSREGFDFDSADDLIDCLPDVI